MEESKIFVEVLNNNSSEIIKNITIIAGPILVLILQLVSQLLFKKIDNKKENIAKKNEQINFELEKFYYPMIELLRKNKIVYNIFTSNKNQEFRTLVEIINGYNFSENDQCLLNEIIKNDQEINKLIFRYKHIIKQDIELSNIINNASVHFTLMEMASNQKIKNESSRFSEHVFPRELENKIEKKIRELSNQLTN